jgi:hypothetical protein
VNPEYFPPSARPATATVAIALQWALAGTLLLIGAVAVGQAIHYDAQIDQAARAVGAAASDVASERSGNVAGTLFVLVPTVLLAGWLGVTAWWMRRGSNVARILALVGLGAPLALGVLSCLAGGLLGLLFVGMLSQTPESTGFEDEGVTAWSGEAFYDELDRLSGDGWSVAFDVLSSTAALLALLLAIATGVLLLVRSTARHFKPAPVHPYPYPFPYPYQQQWPGPYPQYPVPPAPYGTGGGAPPAP